MMRNFEAVLIEIGNEAREATSSNQIALIHHDGHSTQCAGEPKGRFSVWS